MARSAPLVISCALFLAEAPGVGCGGDPVMAPAQPVLVSTSLDDAGDRPVPPTSAIALTFSAAPDLDTLEAGVVVVRGVPDASLLRALAHPPLPVGLLDRVAPLRFASSRGSPTVRALPSRPFDAEALHTLLVTTAVEVGGLRIAAGAERAFTTSDAASGAPWPSLLSPGAGSSAVVRNLREVRVAFSRPVRFVDGGSLQLVNDADQAVQAMLHRESLHDQFVIRLITPLAALSRYRLRASDAIRDDAGDPPFALEPPPGFETGTALRAAPPAIQDLDLAASSGCLVARFATDEPAVARLCLASDCAEEDEPQPQHELTHALAPGAAASVTLSARDLSTAPEGRAGPLAAPVSSPLALVITEVLAHPKGPRLPQQYVELWNPGVTPVALGGLELHDDHGSNTLPDATLAAGARALVVPADFADDDGADVAPAPGTLLVRLDDGHLGGRGLRESGATIWLLDGEGRPVSRFSTVGLKLRAGQSASRVGACDVASSFAPTPGAGATPGGP